jgi:hypothetical protein
LPPTDAKKTQKNLVNKDLCVIRKMENSCCFCNKTEQEVPLIEIASNSLLLGKSYYEFPQIFQELFELVSICFDNFLGEKFLIFHE